MGRHLPAGTVTFLFTDVEGSTKLLHAIGADGYASALAIHRRLLREAFARHGGVEVDTQGDAFFVAFPTAPGALAAAREAIAALTDGPIRVRIGLHTGTPHLTDEGYVGADVHRAARIAAAGHGDQILVSAATAQLVDGADLRDLGLHRLKDLTAPERIYQLGDGDKPPLKTMHQTNLPVPATPFLGRDDELTEIALLLARDRMRLVTLSGPGGIGKTRLALQAAAAAADAYPGGVWWVPLSPLRDPALVLESAAKALGASGDLAEHIGDSRLLLLLDNFEHLLAASADLGALLSRCPNLAVLITSREALHLAGEHEYAVDSLRRTEAVELFMTRALAARRDVAANGEVALICERLDDLPLAIELAAARVKVLSPAALLQRLEQRLPLLTGGTRDAPDRQRTLRATIEWSHELLSEDEQQLFARMAVFRGGCTLAAAEAVADADLDTLGSLVDKSLVRVRDDRFSMLETIREFALEQLERAGRVEQQRQRHADYYRALAEEAEPHVRVDELPWLDRLDLDHDNLRAALDHFEASSHQRDALAMSASLWRFWYHRTYLLEGRRQLERLLADAESVDAVVAKALHGASVMALNLGDMADGRAWAERARAAEAELGNPWGIAYAEMMMGNCLSEAYGPDRDLAAARSHFETAVSMFRDIGDAHYALIANSNLAWVTGELGDVEAERRAHEENLERSRVIGNDGIEAQSLVQLAMFARDEGRLDDALAMAQDSIRIDHRRGSTLMVGQNLGRLASILVRQGRHREAVQLVAYHEAAAADHGSPVAWWAARRNEETISLAKAELGDREVAQAASEGAAMSVDDAVAMALEDA